jgi:CBS domain-containing protein/organic hydroperoxide reductase OsmC/OhrA
LELDPEDEMKTVRDIMSPVVVCLEHSAFLPEAATKLRANSISGAPVINNEGDYVGVLSQTDINSVLARDLDDKNGMQKVLEGDIPRDLQSLQVKEVMTPHILRISADATLKELGQTLLIAGVHRLMVSDDDEVIGLVSTTDLIHGFLSPDKSNGERQPKRPHTPYLFETELRLDGDSLVMSGPGKDVELEAPPEFGGSGTRFSPEDLFVASIGSCMCLTFKEFAAKAGETVESMTCRAIGRLEGDGTGLRFSRVDLYPKITVTGSVEKAEKLLQQAKLRCLVGRSADVFVMMHPEINLVEA